MADPLFDHSRRRTLLFLFVTLLLACLFFMPAESHSVTGLLHSVLGISGIKPTEHPQFVLLTALLPLLFISLCALLPLLTALIAGRRILAWTGLSFDDRAENWVFSAAVGFGALALSTLLLGVTVGLNRFIFLAAVVAVGVLGWKDLLALFRDISEGTDRLMRRENTLGPAFLALPAAILVLLAYLACFVPPMDYDVLEYHLGAPAYWFREGRISFIRYNVYSNFPFNTEMLYLLSMVLTGDKLVGATVANMLNLQFGLLGSAAVGLAARRIFDPKAGWAASLCFLCCPWFTYGAVRAYDTLLLSLCTFLAVYCFWGHVQELRQEDRTSKWLLRSAVMTGLAMGTKYPSFLFVWVPAVLATLAAGLIGKSPKRRLALDMAAIVIVPLVVAGPWMAKNVVNTGNPVYPLLGSVFGGPEWDAMRDAKFVSAHRAPVVGPWGLVKEGAKLAFLQQESSLLVLVFLLPLVWRRERWGIGCFLGYAVLYFVLWAYLTHRVHRFYVPALPGLCVLAGAGLSACAERGLRRAAHAVLALLFCLHTFQAVVLHAAEGFLDIDILGANAENFLARKCEETYQAIAFINKTVGPNDKVLFVGEARTFYCDRNNFLAATVFDRQWIDEAVKEGLLRRSVGGAAGSDPIPDVVDEFRKLGVTHICVHWPEVYRLQSTYAYDYEGRRHPGYLECLPMTSTDPNDSGDARFYRFLAGAGREGGGLFGPDALGRYLKLIKGFGPSTESQPPLFGLYELLRM
jgi:4-amino-4-deoxy-L-arabinose transferase-like glycosyltransferase